MITTWGSGGGLGGLIQSAAFLLPLTDSGIIPSRSDAGVTPTFTRATTSWCPDFEDTSCGGTKTKWNNLLAGEVGIWGARRVRNVLTFTEDFSNAAWAVSVGGTGVTATKTPNYGVAPDGTTTACRVILDKGTGTTASDYAQLNHSSTIPGLTGRASCWIRSTDGVSTYNINLQNGVTQLAITVNGTWQRMSPSAVDANIFVVRLRGTYGTSDTADVLIWHPQFEDVKGQTNQNPSEYVSNGVLAAPYHGFGVDGVKYFTYSNATTITSNVVTQAQGAALTTVKGFWCWQGATQLVTPTASIRDMTDASWVKTTMTAAKTATGIDGVANAASTLTATGANATILQTLTAAASSRTYSAFVRRKTGTGTILLKQGTATLDITSLINSTTYTQVSLNDNELNVAFGFQISTNGDAIEVDMNLFEAGAFATIPIESTATRNADILTYNQAFTTGVTMYGEFTAYGADKSTSKAVVQIDDGTSNNRSLLYSVLPTGYPAVFSNTVGVTQASLSSGANAYIQGVTFKLIGRAFTNDFNVLANGGVEGTDTSGTLPTSPTTVRVGSAVASNSYANGALKNIRIWTVPLSTPTQQALTT